MSKSVFITGATGYIGSHVARAFHQAGFRVLGLTRDPAKATALQAQGVEPVISSLQQPEDWEGHAMDADVLVHAAVDYQADTFALDRESIERLLAFAKDGARVIYTSGVWVAGNTGAEVVDESTAPNPIHLVTARVDTERAVLERGGIVIRPGAVYGERGGLTASWFADAPIVGDGRNRWAMVNAEDLGAAYVLIAQVAASGEIFNIVDDSRSTVGEMAAAARRAAGVTSEIQWMPLADAREQMGDFAEALAIDQQADNRKAKTVLGWEPKRPGFIAGAQIYFEQLQRSQRKAS